MVCGVLYLVTKPLEVKTLACLPRAQRSFIVVLAYDPIKIDRHFSSHCFFLYWSTPARLRFILLAREVSKPTPQLHLYSNILAFPPCPKLTSPNAMMSPSERAIALFLSRTSSNHNRAILYLGITDGNVDDAVALFNSKPDESFRVALSRSAIEFRRPLVNAAKGYEDKYGVIHLETSTEDEDDEEVKVFGKEYGQNMICEGKGIHLITGHPPPRAAISEYGEVSEIINRSSPGGKIPIESTKQRGSKNRRALLHRDSTFEPEKNSASLHQASPTNHDKLPRRRHRGRYARELKRLGFRALGTADDRNPISARTRGSASFKRVGSLPKNGQRSRPRNNLPPNNSPKTRVTGICSLCPSANPDDQTNQSNSKVVTPPPTPRTTIKPNPTTPATPTRRRALRQSSEEYEPYSTPQRTAQSQFKRVKKNTSGVANPRTPSSSNAFGMASYPTPVSISSRPKTSRIRFETSDSEQQLEEILPSAFHRSSFESMSPLALKSVNYDKSKTHQHHYQRDTSEIPLQDLYSAPPSSISTFSFHSAMNLAREKKKWLLINIQSSTVPACGVLNREFWRHIDIADIVRQSFLFLQLDLNDERVKPYLGIYYGVVDLDGEGEEMGCAGNNRKVVRLPHIALLDPVSGHRWKVWDGPGLPDKDLFLADLCEFEMVGEGGWCEWGKGVIREGLSLPKGQLG